ncbi:MAG: hypothetical protein AB8G05_12905 [Oligoflexales bacterium]
MSLLRSILAILLLSTSSFLYANLIIDLSAKKCKHGLNNPPKGAFAIFIFCDDALGTQIGVILQKPGVGPAASKDQWSTYNRFWQDDLAMSDVIQIFWSKSGNFLYVVTSEIYSDGSLYELDLNKRITNKLIDGKSQKSEISMKKAYLGFIYSNDGKKFKIKE